MNSKNKNIRGIGFYVIILLFLVVLVTALLQTQNESTVTYSQVVDAFESEKVTSFTITDGNLQAKLKDNSVLEYSVSDTEMFWNDMGDLIREQHKQGIITSYDEKVTPVPWWASILPYVIIVGLFLLFWFLMAGRQGDGGGRGAMQFGKARAKLAGDDRRKVTFQDVAGADEEKGELEEFVEFLKNPHKFTAIGARIP